MALTVQRAVDMERHLCWLYGPLSWHTAPKILGLFHAIMLLYVNELTGD